MKARSLKYLVGEGFKSTWANRLMTLASNVNSRLLDTIGSMYGSNRLGSFNFRKRFYGDRPLGTGKHHNGLHEGLQLGFIWRTRSNRA